MLMLIELEVKFEFLAWDILFYMFFSEKATR